MGRDLRQVQDAITAAKAELATTSDSAALLQQKLEAAVGLEPTVAQDVLGRPDIPQILERCSGVKQPQPTSNTVLLASNKWQRASRNTKWHSVRHLTPEKAQIAEDVSTEFLFGRRRFDALRWAVQP